MVWSLDRLSGFGFYVTVSDAEQKTQKCGNLMGFRTMKNTLRRWLILLISGFLLIANSSFAEMKLHFIDVGQGDSILIQCDGMNMLVDAGPEEAGIIVHDYLSNKVKISQLDYVIATHEHDDHLFGMPDALSGMTVGKVYSGGSIPMSYWFNKVLPRVQGNTFSVEKPTTGQSFELGEAVVSFFDTLPNPENVNDSCLTFRIDYRGNSALFVADLEGAAENYLLSLQTQLKADILKVGHHGGNTSTGDQFLKAVNPEIAVISVGAGNKHGHPHKEILNRLEKYNITVYRTDLFGTIVLTCDGEGWTIEVSKAR